MATTRKTVSFGVDADVQERTKRLFPEGCNQNALVALLDAYEFPPAAEPAKPDPALTKAAERLAEIADMYDTTPDEAVNTCARYKHAFFDYRDQAARYGTENGLLKQKIDALQTQLDQTAAGLHAHENDPRLRITLQPFARRLLDITIERLAERYGREVTPEQVFVDMFLRYTILRYTEWFYPFVVSDREIVEAAHAYNEEITTISQVKKLFK
ncbi:MAG: hypothetical protein ACI392_00295 [Paludibacteraceae bacterium]